MIQQPKKGPRVMGWEITSQCNLKCPHCFSAAATRPRDEMKTDECKRVIDSLSRIGAEMIGWTGGEPLLRDDLEELIAYARTAGIKSSITTNAVLLDEKRAESLKAAGNHSIQISLDGSTPERNHRMRLATEEEFHKIIEAIRICKRLNIRLYLATLIGRENLDDGPDMIELARREGIEAIRFCGYTPVGRGQRRDIRERLLFDEHMADLHQFVEAAATDESIIAMFDPGFGPTPPGYQFHRCIAGKETFYLKGNGDVYPCTALLHRRFVVDNVRRRPLEDIWNDPAIEEMAEFPRDQITGPCRDCDNFANCRGACRGAAFFHTGDLYASFPACLYQAACRATP